MIDEELNKLILSGIETRARISPEKMEGDIKNIVQMDLNSEKKGKAYVKVAKELAVRLLDKGLSEEEYFPYEKLTDLEKDAIEMIRNDSNRDIEHLKGDYVVSSFLEIERLKRLYGKPPQKRLQLTDKQLKTIFQLKSKNISVREITRVLGLNRGTIIKVLKKDYHNMDDIKRIENAEEKWLVSITI